MKLLNDFFEILQTSVSDSSFVSTLKLNPNHIVYIGHFPGHPVTPGVIQIQIVHELLELHFSRKLKLQKMPKCKFLKILDPTNTSQIEVHIEFKRIENLIKIKAEGKNGSDIYFKFSSSYY